MHARGELARPPEVEAARQALFEARAARVRPGLDDKVLTEWNAYLVAALAEAGAATGETRLGRRRRSRRRSSCSPTCAAPTVAGCGPGRRDAGARHLAYATDHGALVDAFTRLAEATGEARWIAEARLVADALLDLFWDDQHGGVFTTGHDAEALIARPKDLMDNATPGANGLAAVGLLRLAALTGEARYREHGEAIVRLLGAMAVEHPTAFGHLLAAVDLVARGTTEIVVAGDRPDLLDVVRSALPPHRRAGLGRALRQPALGGPGGRPGLRLPGLRVPAAGRGRRDAGRSARHRRRRVDQTRITVLPVFSPVNMAFSACGSRLEALVHLGAVGEAAVGDPPAEDRGDLFEPTP